MILYEFEAPDGERIERLYEPGKAPTVGKWITVKGKRYRRVLSLQRAIVKESRHVGYTLPRKWQNTWLNDCHDSFDEKGRAVFSTKREIKEFEAKAAAKGRPYKFDPDSGVDQSCESS